MFAAYVGSSMYPTLREPEMMEIKPYGNRPLQVGDVAFFLPPAADRPVVHRITSVTSPGICTRGDNNAHEDSFLLQPQHIQGQVVAAWHGAKRRKIAGGWVGRLRSQGLRWSGHFFRGAAPVLHPLYQALSRRGWMARLLPVRFRPRIVVFQVWGQKQYQLLLGRHLIGRYDDSRKQWQIKRPFHLVVDGRVLQGSQDRARVNRVALTQQRRAISQSSVPEIPYALALADGSLWNIAGEDTEAEAIVAQLGDTMRLKRATVASPSSRHQRRLLVQVDAHTAVADCYVPLASERKGAVTCILSPCDHWGGPYVNLMRLSLIMAREAQARGGILLHGALAERNSMGVILVAPGGTGKSTASSRLPTPWRSLSDDTTLVVRDIQGHYRAHPWPTWSRFQDGGPGGDWDVQHAVPLKGIFFLARAEVDRAEQVGPGHAVSMLVEGMRQASQFMPLGLFREEVRHLHLEGFNNLCELARTIPAHILHISLTGTFWRELERVLEGDAR